LGTKPTFTEAKVIVVVEENDLESNTNRSIKRLKGMALKPDRVISLEEMETAIQLEGAKL
jgi:hypothetical protein